MPVHLPGPFQKVVFRLLEDINTPRALSIFLCLRYSDVRQAVSFRCDPLHYTDPEDFARDTMATEFLRKCDIPGVVPSSQLETECFERLLATERTCAETNLRLNRFIGGHLDQPGDARIPSVIQKIREHVAYVVGPIPLSIDGGFGPGATLTNSSRLSTIPDKIESALCGTSALFLFDQLYADSAWERAKKPDHRDRVTVRGNRFFTVPKTALTLRGAALSPNVNGFLQKGIGVYLRRRLKRADIHISGQPTVHGFSVNDWSSADRHRRLACEASKFGDLATIDLSDASNTISKKLIELIFPRQWFDLLSDCREPFMERPDGRMQLLEMFSAMGNGFTFEVETIAFWAICKAVGAKSCSVFGDDIIVPTDSARDVLMALRFFGFTPNLRKTFIDGPFRESCGGDFFDGVPVRAHYVKEIPAAPEQWISLANGLRRFARNPSTNRRWTFVRRAWWAALDSIPSHLRCLRGPEALGDIVIHDPDAKPGRTKDGIHWYRCYAPVSRPIPLSHWSDSIVYASALYGISSDGILSRGQVNGYRVKWVPYS